MVTFGGCRSFPQDAIVQAQGRITSTGGLAMTPRESDRSRRRHTMLRGFLNAVLVVMIMPIVSGRFARSASVTIQAAADNPIVIENQQPGSNGWFWTNLGNDISGQVKGYASATSVNQNESITFYVSVNPAQTYTIDFYRIGWYAGLG